WGAWAARGVAHRWGAWAARGVAHRWGAWAARGVAHRWGAWGAPGDPHFQMTKGTHGGLTILQLAANRWWTGGADPIIRLVTGLGARGHRVLLGVIRGDRFEA